jgi:hypothetical protein
MSLTQTGSTRRRHEKHPKSIWKTAASWFSNTPEDLSRLAEKTPPKEILKKSCQGGLEIYVRGE